MKGAACRHEQFKPQKGRVLLDFIPTIEVRLESLVGYYFSVYLPRAVCEGLGSHGQLCFSHAASAAFMELC